ncbi:MAG: DUF4249 domain-containing protein [Bacteroidota bacterium]
MKNLMKYFPVVTGTFLILCFASCEKEIDLNLPDPEIKIVVQGWIDQNDYAIVMLTRSSPFFSVVDSAAMLNMIVQNATVVVTDGIIYDTLTPTFDPSYFPPFLYKGSILKGEVNKTYHLKVITDSITLTASATVTHPVPLDSAWFEVEEDQDSLGYVWGYFQDPAEELNYYRLFTKRLNKDVRFIPSLYSSYDDKFFNGQSFEFSLMRGIESLTDTTSDPEMGFYKIGDTIIVKACTMDKANYDFWRSAEGEMYSSGNPFASPTQIVTNIEGGGLGVWSGYGVFSDTVICK